MNTTIAYSIQPISPAQKVTTSRPATATSKTTGSGSTPPSPQRSTDENSIGHGIGRVMSHGRGGAGNIGPDPDGYKEKEEDLIIPTIKSPVYTTGRGGSGNMVYNDPNNPQAARIAQDIEGRPAKLSPGEFHAGRGGAGNVGYEGDPDAESAETEVKLQRAIVGERAISYEHEEEKQDYRGWADRGKDYLERKLRGKKSTSS